jgi:undecaprenyl-diphosphatase
VPILHAIILGITQGLSEFLPISSSGHLELVPWLFGWDDFASDPGLETTFDVALHIGTLVGAVAYFWTDILRLGAAGFGALRRRPVGASTGSVGSGASAGAAVETGVAPVPGGGVDGVVPGDRDASLAWLLVLSAVPAGVSGVLFEDTFADIAENHWLIGVLLIVFGLGLLVADRLGGEREADRFSIRDAVVMGVVQAAALQPGVSRSGVTITAARALGFRRDAAARLSFLMSLPIIGGAGLYKGADVLLGAGIPSGFLGAFAAGMAAAAVTGYGAVWATLRLVRTRTFTPFVLYRCIVGAGVILIAVSGVR